MTVSLCMIVRDEEATLPRCLAAAAGLYDELIVVDTGSTDRTVEIAEAHGAQVQHYDWQYPGHKGAARNVGLEAATGDWIVILDADEILRDAAGLRAWLEQAPPDVTGVQLCFENYGDDGGCTLRWYQLRAWRRGLYRYLYREHEVPLPGKPGQDYHEVQLGVVVEHRPPAARTGSKGQPMLDRLLADVEKWPEHAHPAYFLHRQYAILEQWPECLVAGERYLAIAGDNDRCECYGNMAIAATMLGDRQAAIGWLFKAAAEQPQRRTWWVRLAQQYVDLGQWNLASAMLHCALELWSDGYWQSEPSIEHTLLYDLLLRCQQAQAMHAMHAHEHGG